MKKTELLSPAGNMETLLAAIHNGADAVYVGGKFFGARAFAPNFNNEDLKKAVYYAHLYNVKLYITANTVIFEDEIEEFLEYMKFLYEINVDAVIMQDIGMISLVRKLIPDLEIHASTQINAHNDESLKLLKSIDTNSLQLLNIPFIAVTLLVINKDGVILIVVILLHPSNIPSIVVTLLVLNLLRSNVVKELQLLNILYIVVDKFGLKLAILSVPRLVQLLNI